MQRRCQLPHFKNLIQLCCDNIKIWQCTVLLFLTLIVVTQIIVNINQLYICNKIFNNRMSPLESMNSKFDINALKSRTRYDRSTHYKTATFVFTGSDWEVLTEYPLCIATHCSLDRINYLLDFVKTWPGPISVAVFVPGVELTLSLYYIKFLTSCYEDINRQVSFHVTILAEEKDEILDEFIEEMPSWSCEDRPNDVLNYMLNVRSNNTKDRRKNVMFPGNLLRNVARHACQSPWLMNLDIDMHLPRPSPSLNPSITHKLLRFLDTDAANNCSKCLFVIPIFEIASNVTQLPSTKEELISLIDQKRARTFYSTLFDPGHAASEQETKWTKLPKSKDIKVVYQATYEMNYEPLYVAKKGTPSFDERYLQNGMDRDSQTYELHVAGYTYNILDNIFLSHLGYKKPSEHFKAHYIKVTWNNVMKFRKFGLREVSAKYDNDPLNLLSNYSQHHNFTYTVQMSL